MARLTDEDKIKINEQYLILGTYAAVARETGFSPATVKKYIIPDYVPREQITVGKTLKLQDLKITIQDFSGVDNLGELCKLSSEEKKEIHELWDEIIL